MEIKIPFVFFFGFHIYLFFFSFAFLVTRAEPHSSATSDQCDVVRPNRKLNRTRAEVCVHYESRR